MRAGYQTVTGINLIVTRSISAIPGITVSGTEYSFDGTVWSPLDAYTNIPADTACNFRGLFDNANGTSARYRITTPWETVNVTSEGTERLTTSQHFIGSTDFTVGFRALP